MWLEEFQVAHKRWAAHRCVCFRCLSLQMNQRGCWRYHIIWWKLSLTSIMCCPSCVELHLFAHFLSIEMKEMTDDNVKKVGFHFITHDISVSHSFDQIELLKYLFISFPFYKGRSTESFLHWIISFDFFTILWRDWIITIPYIQAIIPLALTNVLYTIEIISASSYDNNDIFFIIFLIIVAKEINRICINKNYGLLP